MTNYCGSLINEYMPQLTTTQLKYAESR